MPAVELREGLSRGVADGSIHVSQDGQLELYNYTRLCQTEGRWDLFTLVARGLVLDAVSGDVVATPFPKFFNLSEAEHALPDEPFEVTEKLDGSLGICFFHNARWQVATRGQLDSPQSRWATAYLHAHVNVRALTPGATYLMEIIYRDNQVVIPYEFEGLVLHGGYAATGLELSRLQLEAIARDAGLRIAKMIAGKSMSDLQTAAALLDAKEEGYVVRFASGLRLKLKGEAYCRVHRLVCRCTPLAVWEAMANGEDLDDIRRELPEEMWPNFDQMRRAIAERFEGAIDELSNSLSACAHLNNKELGLLLAHESFTASPRVRKFLFACRNKHFLAAVHQPGDFRTRLFDTIRPTGNALQGYVPRVIDDE